MTLSGNIDIISTALSDIYDAIVAKGVTPSGNITTYAYAISQIQGGSTPVTLVEVSDNTLIANSQWLYDCGMTEVDTTSDTVTFIKSANNPYIYQATGITQAQLEIRLIQNYNNGSYTDYITVSNTKTLVGSSSSSANDIMTIDYTISNWGSTYTLDSATAITQ